MKETEEPMNSNENENLDIKATSLIAIEIGTINTRASLFDMVEGRYRFLASGKADSTIAPPFSDVSVAIKFAIKNLSSISGRSISNSDHEIIMPSSTSGEGVDNFVASYSGGKPLKTIVVGLLDTISLQSAVNLAQTHYIELIETISINEHGQTDKQIDKIIQSRPDLVIISGGTNGGASKSILKLINILRMAIYLIPKNKRPVILYVGNEELSEKVESMFSPITNLHVADNIRPSLSLEQLGSAQSKLSEISQDFHNTRTKGMAKLIENSGGLMIPASQSLGRVIQFFSKIVKNPNHRGVLGVDLGASSTTIAAAFNGELKLRVITNMGVGKGLETILENSQLKDITRWLMYEIPSSDVLDYIQNKITHPASLPASPKDMAIEQALAREVIQQAIKMAKLNYPDNHRRVKKGVLPNFDPILISGSTIGLAPSPAQSLLMILDSLQPMGIQQIILDKNNLAATLGAAIPVNPTLVSQLLLDPVAFINLGFVISPASKAKNGTPVLKIKIAYEKGTSETFTVYQGTIKKIPLALGQRARIFLDPLQRTNLGLGPGKRIPPHTVVGGPLGLIIDARGRPIKLPEQGTSRRLLLKAWLDSLENTG